MWCLKTSGMEDIPEHLFGDCLLLLQVCMVIRQLIFLCLHDGIQLPDTLQRLDLGPQDSAFKGFGEKIIPTSGHTLDERFIIVQSGQEDHRYKAFLGARLNVARGIVAVHPRHHHVHQHHIRLFAVKDL